MLRSLVVIQLRGLLGSLGGRLGGRRKKARPMNKLLVGLAAIYIIGSLGASLGFYFHTMLAAFAPLGLAWFYFALAGLTAFVFSFLGSVFLAQSSLFAAKDNELLLFLPIKPEQILLARMAALYLMALGIQALVLLPALAVWLLAGSVNMPGLLFFVLTGLLLPLPVLALSTILGWLLSILSSRLRRKNLVIILLSLGFLAAYFIGYSRLIGLMNELVSRGQQLAQAARASLPPAYHYGLALAEGKAASFLLFALFCLAPFALVMWLVSLNYVKVLSTRHGAPKLVYRGGGMAVGGRMRALVKKEMRRFFTSPVYLMNTGIGLLFMLGLPIYLLFDKNALALLAQLGLPQEWLGGLLVLAQCALAGSVFISAPSISLEGRALWIVQSLPVRPINALLAKAMAHILISLPPILLSGAALAWLMKPGAVYTAFLLLLPVLVSVFCALLGLELNLRFPKLEWRSETEPVKQSMSTFLAMSLGFITVAALGALYALALVRTMALGTFLLLCAALFALLSLTLYLHLDRIADRAFLDLSEA